VVEEDVEEDAGEEVEEEVVVVPATIAVRRDISRETAQNLKHPKSASTAMEWDTSPMIVHRGEITW